jgi:BrnA antitoxin of type II toxin-antitoxin system
MRRTISRSRRPASNANPVAKTRITIRVDSDVLDWFRRQAGPSGGYQPLVNRALRDYIDREPLEATLRRVIREELARAGIRKSPHGYADEEIRPALVADSAGADHEYGGSLKRRGVTRRRRKL